MKRSHAAELAFACDLQTWNWDELQGANVDTMVGVLERTVHTLTNIHFPSRWFAPENTPLSTPGLPDPLGNYGKGL